MKKSIYDLTRDQMINWFKGHGKTRYMAEQLWELLYKKRKTDFSMMTDIKYQRTLSFYSKQESSDGTIKFIYILYDGHLIETVMMRHPFGNSVCITTQVGCNIGCSFCASGLHSKVRDLTSGEIVQQLINVQEYLDTIDSNEEVTNIVIMGMGEPFDNFNNLIKALDIFIDHKGLSTSSIR